MVNYSLMNDDELYKHIAQRFNILDDKDPDINVITKELYAISIREGEPDKDTVRLIYTYLIRKNKIDDLYFRSVFRSGKEWEIEIVAELKLITVHDIILIRDSNFVKDLMMTYNNIDMSGIGSVIPQIEALGRYHYHLYHDYLLFQRTKCDVKY